MAQGLVTESRARLPTHKGKWGRQGLSEVRTQTIWSQRSLNLKVCRVPAKPYKDIGKSKEQSVDLAGRYVFLLTVHRQLLGILVEKHFYLHQLK